MPSTSGYLVLAGAGAVALFFVLLLSGGDESLWVPVGLAASLVMLVAVTTREVAMRRAWSRYVAEQARHDHAAERKEGSSRIDMRSVRSHSAALRSIQKQAVEAESPGAAPDAHLEIYHLCKEYISSTDEALRSPGILTENRVAMRAGQERVRVLQRRHLMAWARGASRALTHEAQLRARMSDKIETAMRAIDVIESALRVYPDEGELRQSVPALREFIASVKIAHWIELAERAAFRGQHRRAIDRYHDALFYIKREALNDGGGRVDTEEQIKREVGFLKAKLRTSKAPTDEHSRIRRPTQSGAEDDKTTLP
jgi:hypothetical protein